MRIIPTAALAMLLAGTSGIATAQTAPAAGKPVPPAQQSGSPPPTGAAPETQAIPPGAAPTTNDPALNGRGEAPAGRDATAAFSPGNAAAGAAGQSSTPDWLARWERNNPLGNALRSLKDDGIAITGNYVGNIAGNPVGGVRHGFEESHWVDFGAELDLGKLLGIKGTRLHVQAASFDGASLANTDIGSSISVQQTWRPVPGWRLTQLNIDHDFGRLNVMVGRAALNSYFGESPLNCVFMSNAACLTAYGPITAIGITAFPNSSWAGKLRYAFSKKVYAQVGVFDYNNDLNAFGKGGTDFSFFQGSGKLIAIETGYETTFASARLPHRFRIGLDINTDGGTSPLYDRNGRPAGITGLPRAAQAGDRVGIYALADQTISRPDPRSPRNLAVFGRLFYNLGANSTIDWFASTGFVKTGTFPGRNNDTVDFLISNTHFSADEVDYLSELRAKAGGAGRPHSNELLGEINYGFAAAPGVRLLPNIQWVIHPDPINATRYQRNIPSALVLGLRIDVRLAQFLTGAG